MAEQYYPFDTGPGASVTQESWSRMARTFRPSAVGGDISSTSLKVIPSASIRTSTIQPGEGFILGHQYVSDAPIDVTHVENTSGVPRIDLVVLRRDRPQQKIYPAVITGVPSANPEAPEPLGDHNAFISSLDPGDLFDIPLSRVRVDAGAATIPSSSYTDVRWMGAPAFTTGTSVTRNPYWGMRPFGSMHYEYDTRRWMGWDGYKWGIIAEQGPWRTYQPKIYWRYNSTNSMVLDNSWSTNGRWRYVGDNTVAFSITATLNSTIPSGPNQYPEGFMQISLPVKSGPFPSGNDTVLPLIYQSDTAPGAARSGIALVWPNSDYIGQIWFNHVTGSPNEEVGTLDVALRDNGWPKTANIRISGTYETAGA